MNQTRRCCEVTVRTQASEHRRAVAHSRYGSVPRFLIVLAVICSWCSNDANASMKTLLQIPQLEKFLRLAHLTRPLTAAEQVTAGKLASEILSARTITITGAHLRLGTSFDEAGDDVVLMAARLRVLKSLVLVPEVMQYVVTEQSLASKPLEKELSNEIKTVVPTAHIVILSAGHIHFWTPSLSEFQAIAHKFNQGLLERAVKKSGRGGKEGSPPVPSGRSPAPSFEICVGTGGVSFTAGYGPFKVSASTTGKLGITVEGDNASITVSGGSS